MLVYLQLCRLPTVFTAMADIVLGFVLTRGVLSPASDVALLIAASSGMYLAGMVFNDVFDRRVDAVERPDRPLPSGRVSLRQAVALGTGLLLAGIGSAAISGTVSLTVSVLLTACILLYDGLLKGTPLGPLAMGGCRFLNVLLGGSAGVATLPELFSRPQVIVAAALGVYIAGVTWFASREAGRSRPLELFAAMTVINLGLIGLLGFVFHSDTVPADREQFGSLLVLVVIAATINRRLAAALFDPQPANVQRAVGTLLMSLVMLDATLVFAVTGNGLYAGGTALLLAPTLLLSRWIPMT